MSTQSHIVVGYEGEPTGRDVIEFASHWARAGGDKIIIVTVYDTGANPGAAHVDAEWVAYSREQADKLLAEARTLVDPELDVEFRRIPSSSAAHGLHDLLEDTGTDTPLVILGSRHTRGLRRTYPGSTAEGLLQGSPAPVAVVPWGYAHGVVQPFTKVAVAYVDTEDGHVALEHAIRIATHLGTELDVISVVPDTRVVPSLGDISRFGAEQHSQYQEAMNAAMATVPDTLKATGRLVDGPVVDALADIRPGEADLLVCGSRGYGPVRRVLLGGVSARVVRHARIPVVVVPRG